MQLITVILTTVLIKISFAEQCISSYHIENTCTRNYDSLSTVSYNVRSVCECTSICNKYVYCNSAIFDWIATTCTTSAWKLWTLSADCNQKEMVTYVELKKSSCKSALFENCLEDADCSTVNASCYNWTCECHKGFSYDPISRKCTDRCDTYGSTFSATHNARLKIFHEIFYDDSLTPQECADHCLKPSKFICRAFGFRPISTRSCILTELTLQEQSSYGHSGTWLVDYYTRNCN